VTERDLQQRLITRAVEGRYRGFITLGALLAVVGAVLFVLALTGDEENRAWQAFQVNWLYFTGLTVGSLALNAVYKVANAKWAGVIVRFSQATVFFAVVSLLGCALIFTVGYDAIYGPMQEQLHGMSPGKQLWLSHGFMAARLLLGLLALFTVGWLLVRHDLLADMVAVKGGLQDARRAMYDQWTAGYDASPAGLAATDSKIRRLAPLYVVLYALVATLVAFDGIMALQPHWFSNLLGGFYFMGSFLGGHTLLVLLMLYGRRQLRIADLVSPKQRHDLGKMCFGFTVFWAYLMWAQFLVIWYGNLPEETGFVFARLWGPWLPVGRWVFLGMFFIPFWGFLFVAAKKSPFVLGLFATVSLVALWLERYLLVTPSVASAAGPVFGVPEAGPLLAFLGCFLLAYGLFARTFPMVSPRLATITLSEERKHGHGEEFFHDEKPKDFAMPPELERRDHER
jgi:Ni/Fe-hydrogenase subunit HybB-like protein